MSGTILMNNNKRIAKNTLMLYFRMILIVGCTFYTSRVILKVLGVQDYGIYNVVGGVVAMLNLLVGSLRAATQRFITFELGKAKDKDLTRVFSVSVTVHILISLLILIFGESIGVWFLNVYMNIPSERIVAANWVFQFSIFTFIINLVAVPYDSAIIAFERMSAFAYISIVEVTLSLLMVLSLPLFGMDKLIIYALLVMIITLIIRLVYTNYCIRHFRECKFHFYWDKKLFKEIFSFAGWNFIGAGSGVLMTQGVNIVLNIFYGVIVNAARGIANQVQSGVTMLISNFMMALNPQITKSYVAGENVYLQKLLRQGTKYSYFLMLLVSLPILLETESILNIWLGKVPQYTIEFVRLTIVYSLLLCLSNPLVTAMLATGKIKRYQIIVGGIQLLNFPCAFIALKLGVSPQVTYIIQIFFELCCFCSRLWLLRMMIQFEARNFVSQVLIKIVIVSVLSIAIPYLFVLNVEPTNLRLFLVSLLSVSSVSVFVFLFGLSDEEKKFLIIKICTTLKNKKL